MATAAVAQASEAVVPAAASALMAVLVWVWELRGDLAWASALDLSWSPAKCKTP